MDLHNLRVCYMMKYKEILSTLIGGFVSAIMMIGVLYLIGLL